MKIIVTQDDIDNGRKGLSFCCPVALALNRHYEISSVSKNGIACGDKNHGAVQIPTPPSVIEFIMNFDADRPVKPFEFDLEMEIQP